MYSVTIRHKSGVKTMQVDELNDSKLTEELDKEYIEVRIARLKQERDEALWHLVGTSYYNQLAQEKNNEIKLLLERK